MNTPDTPTIFRRFPVGDIIALFPTIKADADGNHLSYQHIGQHGAANIEHVIVNTTPATPDEYAELKDELEDLGYYIAPVDADA